MLRAHPPRAKDPEGVANLIGLAKAARQRMPQLVQEIEALVGRVDPLELLSQLTLLFQTHAVGDLSHRNESAKWQVRIEWLCWLVFARRLTAPSHPEIIDSTILGPLETLLGEYVTAVTMTLPEPVEGLSGEQDDIRALLQLEAIHVRGEAFQSQLQHLATALYSPHDSWCLAHLGFTISDALVIARAIAALLADKLSATRAAANDISNALRSDAALAAELRLPYAIRETIAGAPAGRGIEEETAKSIAAVWFFSQSPSITGFTSAELQRGVAATCNVERVEAFLTFASIPAHDIGGEPDLLSLPPVAKTPLIQLDGKYYLFVPGRLFEGIYYGFHSRLFADEAYRATYNTVRADWLERTAIEAFKAILPNAEAGWGLDYGPKRQRLNLDGLVSYDKKLVLVECKWKAPTLVALGGDVAAAIKDIDGAILEPLRQAKRARDWISQREVTEFIEKSSGRRIVIRRQDVEEVFLVTLVGSGAWSLVAANLPRFTPLGLFADGEFPWALSLTDLRAVADCLELPAELFDFLRRRYEMQQNPRFWFHDEWDLLGSYLAGALDARDPQFENMDADIVTLDGFDGGIQDYYHALGAPAAVERPRRPMPANLRDLILTLERLAQPNKTDAVGVMLAWPNWGLEQLSQKLEECRRKAVWDGRAHAVGLPHPWRPSVVVFACGHGDPLALQQVLAHACRNTLTQTGASELAGFGIDLAAPWEPVFIHHKDRPGTTWATSAGEDFADRG